MLNLITLSIKNEEINKEIHQHKLKMFNMGAIPAVIFSCILLLNAAFQQWVLKRTNVLFVFPNAGGCLMISLLWLIFSKKY